MTDWDVEQIKYETERVKLLSLLTVAVGGGSIGLLLGDFTSLRLVLAGTGLVLTLTLGVASWRLDKDIRATIAREKGIL